MRPFAVLSIAAVLAAAPPSGVEAADRTNPLVVRTSDGQTVGSCADPTVIRGQTAGDSDWYMYCTMDPLGDWDKDALGGWIYHRIPIFRSSDLVRWTYAGDAVASMPTWAELGAGLWAPEIQYFNGKYYLYYAVTDTKFAVSGERLCGEDSAVGVATSTSPTGPFTDHGSPVVSPRRNGTGCDFRATIDPDVLTDASGNRWIYYGSFKGGIEVRPLSSDGFTSNAASATLVASWDKYEGAEVKYRNGWYYLFVSAAGCCDGPASGYTVFVGRSANPNGPFVDEEGVSLTAARAGGTTVLSFTGNRWVGTGHNTVFTDVSGQWWTIYHAIDLDDPYFAGSVGFTKRPPFLDPIDWTADGWPTARGGWWLSTCSQPAPAAQTGQTSSWQPTWREDDLPGALLPEASDEFDGAALDPKWTWIRPPPSGTFGIENGTLRLDTQAAELYVDQNDASVLTVPAPAGDIVVETRVRLTVPSSGCCYNYVQAGLVLYRDDDNYLKQVHVAIWGTRQTEFAKELSPVPAGYPRYGGTRAGPPGDWTWLRIVRRAVYGGEVYTAYSSLDGLAWSRSGAWTHALGANAKIGLVSMNVAGYTAYFDYVRTYRLGPPNCTDPSLADPCDVDLDGIGDRCDPDDDNDGLEDALDCASIDASQGRPAEVSSLTLSGNGSTVLDWLAASRADLYDVTRGSLSSLAPGGYGACFANDLAATTAQDPATPPPNDGFVYLVRGVDAGCGGPGTWGSTSGGMERSDSDPNACP